MRTILLIGLMIIYSSIKAQTPETQTALLVKELKNQFEELQFLNNKLKDDVIKLKESILLKTAKKHSFSVFGGYTENGFSFLGSYNFYNSNELRKLNDFIELSFLASFSNEDLSGYEIPVNNYTLNAGYFKRIPMLSGTLQEITTTIGLGGLIGYESINANNQDLPNGALILDESKFIYGGFIGMNVDIFISNHFDLTAKSNLYYHPNSNIGKTKIFIGVGLKYSILKKIKQ